MADTIRIKRRAAGGAAGAPASLSASELAYNEQDDTFWYGKGNSAGNATSIVAVGGSGSFLPLSGGTLSGGLSFGSLVAPGGAQDLSRHIALFSTNYGFNITSATLNYNSTGNHTFWASATKLLNAAAGGITAYVPLTLAADPTVTLGAATKQYVDNTSAALSTVAPQTNWDMNSLNANYIGMIRIQNQTTPLNMPPCYSNTGIVVMGITANTAWDTQILFGASPGASDPAPIWARAQNNGVWQPWTKLITAA